MTIMQQGGSRIDARDGVHLREYEYQATYRGYLFGPFRFLRQGQSTGELMQRRNKAGMLLKWFLLNPGKPGSAEAFMDLFWSDIPPRQALGNFHVTMHYLRRILEPDLSARKGSTFIQRTPKNFYWLEMDQSWWADTNDVQAHLERAHAYDHRGESGKAAYYYRKVASYCSQGFLPEDASEEWLDPYRKQYEHMYSQVLIRLIQLYREKGEWEEMVEYAYQALHLDPYHEIAAQTLIDAYLQQENIPLAQSKLETFWHSLQQDLGLRPGKEFYALRERIQAAES